MMRSLFSLLASLLVAHRIVHAAPFATETYAEDPFSSAASSAGSVSTMRPQAQDVADFQQTYRSAVQDILKIRDMSATCNVDNVQVRKEWYVHAPSSSTTFSDLLPSRSTISEIDRKSYIEAVYCLASVNPLTQATSLSQYAAVVNRYEEYVAAHLLKTDDVHFNGVFLSWHRHFLWLYDQDLRNICGYSGPTPYWDWTNDSDDPRTSSVFDGSEYSMGGNGEHYPHGISDLSLINAHLILAAGTGGGCLTQGPFADWTVHIGNPINVTNITDLEDYPGAPPDFPYSPGVVLDTPVPQYNITSALAYHSDCIRRDLNPGWSNLATTDALAYLLSCDDLLCFQTRADGFELAASPAWDAFNKLHTAGHLSIGGLNNDVYASAGDPAFWLHHAMVDRIWAIWQGQNMSVRPYETGAGRWPFNSRSFCYPLVKQLVGPSLIPPLCLPSR